MKKELLFLVLLLNFISFSSAMPISLYPANSSGDPQPNLILNYTFNFTLSSDCSNVVLSNSSIITLDKNGKGFIDLDISGLTQVPNYLCEYKNGTLRKIHTLSDQTFRDVYARKGNFSSNVTADWFFGKISGSNVQNTLTYNITYDGLINNQSYLTTFNSTYDKWSYNQTYSGSTYNITYEGLINNASYLSTYNSTYELNQANSTFNQSLLFVINGIVIVSLLAIV